MVQYADSERSATMKTQTLPSFFAFGAVVALCFSAAAAALLPDHAAEATDLGIFDVTTVVWSHP